MKRHLRVWGAVVLLAAMPLPALAQERGRTDGPEGSEYGKGGYSSARGGQRLSLELDWGAAVHQEAPPLDAPDGPPLFVGVTASFWADDWFLLDFSGAYIPDGGRVNVLVGPRFRTWGYPLSLHAGLKVGAIVIPEVGLRFGLSPQVGADLLMGHRENIILGLTYALDIPQPVEIDGGGITHRLFMSLGYRF